MTHTHLMKLSVGTESVEDLADWQASQRPRWPKGCAVHVTRMWPKREAEVLNGGSIYWVIKGVILCRQRIVGLEQVEGGDGITRCAIVLDEEIIRTQSAPRRAFQGWRYLDPKDAPPDLMRGREHEEALPPGLAEAMAEFGLR
jgi:hypothetical protein